jgi:hypothetical protein
MHLVGSYLSAAFGLKPSLRGLTANRSAGPIFRSRLLNKLRLKLHSADPVDFAVNIVILIDQTVDPHFRSDFHRFARAFDFQVFDERDHVAVFEHIAIGVAVGFGRAIGGGPLKGAFGTDEQRAVFIDIFAAAFGAGRDFGHFGSNQGERNIGKAGDNDRQAGEHAPPDTKGQGREFGAEPKDKHEHRKEPERQYGERQDRRRQKQ